MRSRATSSDDVTLVSDRRPFSEAVLEVDQIADHLG
jgi:hypothetical protein